MFGGDRSQCASWIIICGVGLKFFYSKTLVKTNFCELSLSALVAFLSFFTMSSLLAYHIYTYRDEHFSSAKGKLQK